MATVDHLERVIQASHDAVDAFVRGDPEPLKALYSREGPVSIANPFGPPAVGWSSAAETMDRAARNFHDGRATGFERLAEVVTPGLAYTLEIERFEARLGDQVAITPFALRVTTVFRSENEGWKIVHRHADPITSARSATSVVEAPS
jgi:ketosteroid isomerase-like protein